MQQASRVFQKVKPVAMDAAIPVARLNSRPPGMYVDRKAQVVAEFKSKLAAIEAQVTPNPLMHRPGETNPLGEYSPYLPPLQIPGIPDAVLYTALLDVLDVLYIVPFV